MNKKLTKLLSLFIIAGTIGTGVAGIAGCKKKKGGDNGGGGGSGEEPHVHQWSDDYYNEDADEHWKTCSGCEEVSEKGAHVYDDEYDADCNTCGHTRQVPERIVVSEVNISGPTSVKPGKSITVTASVTVNSTAAEDLAYTLAVTAGADLVDFNAETGVLTAKAEATAGSTVTVTATSKKDTSKTKTHTVTIAALTYFDTLNENVLLKDDFNDKTGVIGDFSGSYGTTGFYSNAGSNATTATHNGEYKNGAITMNRPSAGEAIVIADLGPLAEHSKVEGFFEMTFAGVGGSWTPVRFYGDTVAYGDNGVNPAAENSEGFALRTTKEALQYRVGSKGAVTAPDGGATVALKETPYQVHYVLEWNETNGTYDITVEIDGTAFVTKKQTILTSLKAVNFYSSNGNDYRVCVDDFVACGTHVDADSYRPTVLANLKTELAKYGTYDEGTDALTASETHSEKLAELNEKYAAGKEAINAAATIAEINTQYTAAVEALKTVKSDATLAAEALAAAKTEKKAALTAHKAEKYDQLTPEQKAAVDAEIGDGTTAGLLKDGLDAIDAATSVDLVETEYAHAISNIDNLVNGYFETAQQAYEKADGQLTQHVTTVLDEFDTAKDTAIEGLLNTEKTNQMALIAAAKDAEGATADSVYDAINAAKEAITKVATDRKADGFTITYADKDGSTRSTAKVAYGTAATKPEDPTEENKKFVRWCTAADLANEYTFTEELYSDVTVYAEWKEADVTITLKVDGVDKGTVKTYSGGSINDIKYPKITVEAGKKIGEWTKEGGGALADGDLTENANITLVATTAWKSDEELANGLDSWVVEKNAVTEAAPAPTSVYDGKLIDITSDDGEAIYKTGVSTGAFTTIDGTKSLTKAWQGANTAIGSHTKSVYVTANEAVKIHVYTALADSKLSSGRKGAINYKLNGGAVTTVASSDAAKVITGTLTLDLNAGDVLEIYGDVYDTNTYGARLYIFGVEAELSESFTNTTVIFHDGTGAAEAPLPWVTYKELEHANATSDSGEFVGWATTAGATKEDAKELSEIKLTAGETTNIYPVFAVADVTVKFFIPTGIGDDGSHIYDMSTDVTLNAFSGKTLSEDDAKAKVAEKEGYKFVGWYTDSTLETPYEYATTLTAGELILYAKYEVITAEAKEVYLAKNETKTSIAENDLIADNTLFTATSKIAYNVAATNKPQTCESNSNVGGSGSKALTTEDYEKKSSHDLLTVTAKENITLKIYVTTQKANSDGYRASNAIISGDATSTTPIGATKNVIDVVTVELTKGQTITLKVTGTAGSSFTIFVHGIEADLKV